jgi:hypothetical protein
MGSPGVPINIGMYCSDFVIQDPVSFFEETTPYYSRVYPETNQRYYLMISAATGGFVEVEDPLPSDTILTADDFKIRLHWDKTIRPVVENNTITPQNELRYLSSINRPDPNGNNIVKFNSDNSITLRTTKSREGIYNPLDRFSTVATTGRVTYSVTTKPPDKVERSQNLVYLVNDEDDDGGVITSSTRKRYLIIDPTNADALASPTVSWIDLFQPRVTENMVKLTAYSINRKTSLENSSTIT